MPGVPVPTLTGEYTPKAEELRYRASEVYEGTCPGIDVGNVQDVPAITLAAGVSVRTRYGVYTPEVDEVWIGSGEWKLKEIKGLQ